MQNIQIVFNVNLPQTNDTKKFLKSLLSIAGSTVDIKVQPGTTTKTELFYIENLKNLGVKEQTIIENTPSLRTFKREYQRKDWSEKKLFRFKELSNNKVLVFRFY